MRSPVLPPIRMKAAETSASSAIAPCTPLTVVSRSSTTAEIDTFISEVWTTSTNIAIAGSRASRPLNGTVRIASASMAQPNTPDRPRDPPAPDEMPGTRPADRLRASPPSSTPRGMGRTASAELAGEAVHGALHRGDLDVREAAVRAREQHRLVRGPQGVPHPVGLALERGAQRADLEAQPRAGDDLDGGLDVAVRVVGGSGR